MKVLIVHRLIASFGGAHKYLCQLVSILSSMGCAIHLAINPNSATRPLLSQLQEMGVSLHEIDFDVLSPQDAGQRFDRLLDEISPDIIDFEAAAKSIRTFALSSEKFAVSRAAKVFTMHLPIVTDQSELHGWRAKIPFSQYWHSLRERRTFLQLFDKGLSVSEHNARSIAKLLRIPRSYFAVIPNGVDTTLFRPNDKKPHEGPFRIVACGGLTRQKRFDLLIKAAALLAKSHQKFEVHIAGEGAERDSLTLAIERAELAGQVFLCGHVGDMPKFLSEGDLYVLCSDSEGLPYATLEAMACGLPSVVTRVGELPYLVRSGVEGEIVNCGSAELLAESISRFINGKRFALQCGQRARERIVKSYNHDVIEQETINFFAHLFEDK